MLIPCGVEGSRRSHAASRQRRRGEERAWGRRLAKRFGLDGKYDAKSFISKAGAQDGFLDFESAKPEKLDS